MPKTAIAISLAIAQLSACSCDKGDPRGGIDVGVGATLEIDGRELSVEQVDTLRRVFATLPAATEGVTSKPNLVVTISNRNGDKGEFSIWSKTGFFYDGNYLGAWTQRMTQDEAEGYRLSVRQLSQLRQIVSESAPQALRKP